MKIFLVFLLAVVARAQSINTGGGSVYGFTPDQYFTGGVNYTDATLGPGVLMSMRYAVSFRYDIPVSNGLYMVTLRMIEPNKTAAKQRLFTVTANGQTTEPIDLFALVGPKVEYTRGFLVLASANWIRLQFSASAGNALVSSIEIQPQGMLLAWVISDYRLCNSAGPGFDCKGLEYVKFQKGAEQKTLVGIETSASYSVDVSNWQSLPLN